MKKIGYILVSVLLVIILIPLIILGGTGSWENSYSEGQGSIAVFPGDNDKENGDNQSSSSPNIDSEPANIDEASLKIKVYIAEKSELQEMDLEEYIVGVISGEMPAGFDAEALKAQAVASRTYALTRMRTFGGKGCDKHPEADICTDSGHCQEWISKEDRFKSWNAIEAQSYWTKLTNAVKGTKGLILIYNAVPVMYPLYFSTSSGKTENSEEYYSNPVPYLKSVVSPNEEEAPKFITTVSFSIDEFVKKFYDSKYKIQLDKTKLQTQFKILGNTEGGSVKTIQVGSETLTGRDVREILGLNSANFRFEIGKKDITFTVTGNGHGVGMSQWGANEMGKRGSKYDEILKHYYQGVEIESLEKVYMAK